MLTEFRQNLPIGRASGLMAAIGSCLLITSAVLAQAPAALTSAAADCWLLDDKPLLAPLKNQTVIGDWTYSLGGEFRYRYMNEHNRLRPEGTTPADYDQWRIAPYVELKNDWLTAYVQGIDASTFNSEIAIIPPDVNRTDLLLYYLDAALWESDQGTFHVRVGRQFLKYGSQYLVSPLPWANTYRNFEGIRGYWQSDLWDVDVFAVRPVNGAAVPSQWRPTSHDIPDSSAWLSGIYASRKKFAGGAWDNYWLWNREYQRLEARQDGNRHTFGSRYWGTTPLPMALPATWLWDLEGGWQVGTDNYSLPIDRDVNAGFAGATGAITLTKVPWTPTVKGLFWWGSGDGHPADGSINTVTTMYSFVHYYWGILDNFNGSNLLQYSAQFSVKPTSKLTLNTQLHYFDKAEAEDSIYNAAGVAFGGPSTSRHIGEEIDLIATYALSTNLEVQAGYSWFWYGPAVSELPAIRRGDAHQAYIMTTWGF